MVAQGGLHTCRALAGEGFACRFQPGGCPSVWASRLPLLVCSCHVARRRPAPRLGAPSCIVDAVGRFRGGGSESATPSIFTGASRFMCSFVIHSMWRPALCLGCRPTAPLHRVSVAVLSQSLASPRRRAHHFQALHRSVTTHNRCVCSPLHLLTRNGPSRAPHSSRSETSTWSKFDSNLVEVFSDSVALLIPPLVQHRSLHQGCPLFVGNHPVAGFLTPSLFSRRSCQRKPITLSANLERGRYPRSGLPLPEFHQHRFQMPGPSRVWRHPTRCMSQNGRALLAQEEEVSLC